MADDASAEIADAFAAQVAPPPAVEPWDPIDPITGAQIRINEGSYLVTQSPDRKRTAILDNGSGMFTGLMPTVGQLLGRAHDRNPDRFDREYLNKPAHYETPDLDPPTGYRDADYDRDKERFDTAVKKWKQTLGLGPWQIHREWYREPFKPQPDSRITVVADMCTTWQYMEASLRVYVPAAAGKDDDFVDRIIVHELTHALVNELRGLDWRDADAHLHEERVVSMLTNAVMWTHAAGWNEAEDVAWSELSPLLVEVFAHGDVGGRVNKDDASKAIKDAIAAIKDERTGWRRETMELLDNHARVTAGLRARLQRTRLTPEQIATRVMDALAFNGLVKIEQNGVLYDFKDKHKASETLYFYWDGGSRETIAKAIASALDGEEATDGGTSAAKVE